MANDMDRGAATGLGATASTIPSRSLNARPRRQRSYTRMRFARRVRRLRGRGTVRSPLDVVGGSLVDPRGAVAARRDADVRAADGGDARERPDASTFYRKLGEVAWRLSEELGWAKTYDAEYLALALHLDCRFVTLDGRLSRGADRLGFVIEPG